MSSRPSHTHSWHIHIIISCCRAAVHGAGCFDGLARLRDKIVEVELPNVTPPRGALGLGSPAAAIAQSLSRVLRPERLTIRATPGGPSPMLMHGAEGPGPALEFGAMLTKFDAWWGLACCWNCCCCGCSPGGKRAVHGVP